jgi:DNA-binding MarR family transcriptional regulator
MSEGLNSLEYWRKTLLQSIRNGWQDLPTRQAIALFTIYLSGPLHTVRGLAQELGAAKPAITRVLNALEKLGFLKRKIDETGLRSLFTQRTVKGGVFLRAFSDTIVVDALD